MLGLTYKDPARDGKTIDRVAIDEATRSLAESVGPELLAMR